MGGKVLSAEGGRSDRSVTVKKHRAARHTGGVAGQCCSRVNKKQDVSVASVRRAERQPSKENMRRAAPMELLTILCDAER